MSSLVKNLAVSLVSIIVTFILCEIGARFLVPPHRDIEVTVTARTNSTETQRSASDDSGSISPVLDWSGPHGIRLYPNITATIHHHTLSKQDVTLTINSLGLRSPELSKDKGDEFRILAMGDSITLGDYLAQSDTIPDRLQKNLSSINPHIVVANAGLPGACTSDEFYHYEEISDVVKPDIVLVGMYLNDAQNSEQFYAKKLAFPYSASRFLSFVSERLHFLNIQQSVQNVGIDPAWKETFRAGRDLKSGYMLDERNGFDFEIYNASEDFGLAWNGQAWNNLAAMIEIFSRAVRERHQKFLLYLLPVHMQVYSKEDVLSTYPQDQFHKMCQRFNLDCLDLLPKLRIEAKNISMRDMYYDHCHYKKAGNEIIARILNDWIKNYVPKT